MAEAAAKILLKIRQRGRYCGVRGVARGGSMMAVASTLIDENAADRNLYLYDTFEGMPRPTDHDVRWNGQAAAEKFARVRTSEGGSDWCRAAIDEVKENLGGTGYPPELCLYIKGLVEETIPGNAPDRIAILRLDTDWYQSTRHELEHLYPRLVSRGVLIIDDYGDWQGALPGCGRMDQVRCTILLNRIDTTGRIGIKL